MATEDFTTYTEVDPLAHVSVTSSTITGTGITRDETTLVYSDKGVNHFDGDFTHLVDFNASNDVSQGIYASWALTNDIGDIVALRAASKSFLHTQHNGATTLILFEEYLGTGYSDFTTVLISGQTYYLTFTRDESVGSFGQLTCIIYSDSIRTTIVDTLVLLLHAKLDFQYVFGLMSYDDNQAGRQIDVMIRNLDLGEAVDGGIIYPSILVPIPSLTPLVTPGTIPGGTIDNTWITN